MTRKKSKTSTAVRDEHFEAIDQLLTQLRTHLTDSAGKKGTYGDYLRLLEAYQGSEREQPRQILVSWVDPEEALTEDIDKAA